VLIAIVARRFRGWVGLFPSVSVTAKYLRIVAVAAEAAISESDI
jgi:hypothetical protein